MYFSETGLLCSHSLRVYHLHCVRNIPQEYIMKRWKKAAMCSHGIEEPTLRTNVVATSVWRSQTIRKFVKLITSCQNSLNARAEVECYFNLLKEKVESVSGVIDFSEPVKEVEIVDLEIKNPPKARPKGERNVRPKSTLEKQCNKAKGNFKRKKSLYTPYKRGIGQAVVQVGLKSAVVEEIPSISKESNHSISNDFDQVCLFVIDYKFILFNFLFFCRLLVKAFFHLSYLLMLIFHLLLRFFFHICLYKCL
ncbi:uncharacterized protein LOC110719951 isoform X2 [Chenopodium quinoa]|uniref:uncharacterized protein LOC110719951 isoform X2 n=1 Tax=Chenopodium quinoa TaxID=63459 RepID=UPI000B77007B|nr:uncharacterized protein LOC110719951 isoform X2 [Chenopodium quinoa]